MIKKELIFMDDSVSIIESLVKKYNLVINEKQNDDIITPDILAASEIAQIVTDITKKRYSIEECSLKFQKIFNISSEIANNIIQELDISIVSKAQMIKVEQKESSSSSKDISSFKENQEEINKSIEQDSYREPTK